MIHFHKSHDFGFFFNPVNEIKISESIFLKFIISDFIKLISQIKKRLFQFFRRIHTAEFSYKIKKCTFNFEKPASAVKRPVCGDLQVF